MKLIDGLKEKGSPFEIPDCSRDDLPEFFKELGFTTGVEIGVQWGDNLEKYCKVGLKMWGVDPYLSYPEHKCTKYIEELYPATLKRLSPYPNCNLIRKMSLDAVNDFSKRSLDFVYIDGNHTFGHTAMDLMRWSEKVKKGGVISGHDYFCLKGDRKNRAVGPVVDAFVKTYDINNWYLLGKKVPDEGEKTDESLTFMIFKNW